MATSGWDVGPRYKGASRSRTSSISANHLGIESRAVAYGKASIQYSPHDEAKERFEKMGVNIK